MLSIKKILAKILLWIKSPLIDYDTHTDGGRWYSVSNSNATVRFGTGSNGSVNHGLYSTTLSKWLIYGNASSVYVNGINMSPITETSQSNVINVNDTYFTVSSCTYTQWGKVAMLTLGLTSRRAITVPASGNVDDIDIGTIVSGKRPPSTITISTWGNNAGKANGYIASNGVCKLTSFDGTGSQRTIATGSAFNFTVTYLVS